MEKNLLITGGSSGIGLAVTHKFLEKGYRVFNLDNKKPDKNEKNIKNIKNIKWLKCDMKNVKNIKSAVMSVIRSAGRLDAVVSNAAKHVSGTIEETSENIFDELMAINLKGTFFLLKYVLPILKKQKSGSIVLMGSDQCFIGKSHSAVYGATKSAIGQLAKSVALDYSRYNIRVNCICPGTIDTPLYQKAVKNYCMKTGKDIHAVHIAEAAEQPLNRIGLPEEVSHLAYFLCSEEAAFITGALFPIDGGYTAK